MPNYSTHLDGDFPGNLLLLALMVVYRRRNIKTPLKRPAPGILTFTNGKIYLKALNKIDFYIQ
jgi:hypothetical protein